MVSADRNGRPVSGQAIRILILWGSGWHAAGADPRSGAPPPGSPQWAGCWHHPGMDSGYSGTPLAKKLCLKSGLEVCALYTPRDYRDVVTSGLTGVRKELRAI